MAREDRAWHQATVRLGMHPPAPVRRHPSLAFRQLRNVSRQARGTVVLSPHRGMNAIHLATICWHWAGVQTPLLGAALGGGHAKPLGQRRASSVARWVAEDLWAYQGKPIT